MLTASVRSQSALDRVSTKPVGPATPALFTSTSSPPSSRATAWNSAATLSSSDTSARSVHARQLGGQRGQPGLVHVADEHPGAGAMEHAGHLQAQPVGARGDQDLLSSEIDFFEHASCLLVLTWPTPLGDIRYIFHYAKKDSEIQWGRAYPQAETAPILRIVAPESAAKALFMRLEGNPRFVLLAPPLESMARFHDPISHISYIQRRTQHRPVRIPYRQRSADVQVQETRPGLGAVRRGGDRNRGGGHEGGGPLPIQRRAGAAGGELSRPGAGRQRDQRRGRHQRREDPDRQGRRGRPDPGRVRNQAPDLIQRDRRVRQLRVRHFLRRLAGHGAGGRAYSSWAPPPTRSPRAATSTCSAAIPTRRCTACRWSTPCTRPSRRAWG